MRKVSVFPEHLKGLVKEKKEQAKEHGRLSDSAIAEEIGKSVPSLRAYMRGEQTPDFETLIRIADYFDVSIDYLLGKTEIHSADVGLVGICNATGLSEAAVLKLLRMNEKAGILVKNESFRNAREAYYGFNYCCTFLSTLITSEHLQKIADNACYIDSALRSKAAMENNEDLIPPINADDDYIQNGKRYENTILMNDVYSEIAHYLLYENHSFHYEEDIKRLAEQCIEEHRNREEDE